MNKTETELLKVAAEHGYVTFEVGHQTTRGLTVRNFGRRQSAAASALVAAGKLVLTSESDLQHRGTIAYTTYTYKIA